MKQQILSYKTNFIPHMQNIYNDSHASSFFKKGGQSVGKNRPWLLRKISVNKKIVYPIFEFLIWEEGVLKSSTRNVSISPQNLISLNRDRGLASLNGIIYLF